MIKVTIEKQENEIHSIVISGHSGYDESGKDIVCASVSSIAITTVNAILRIDYDAIRYEEKDGLLKLTIQKQSDMISLLLTNMLDLLEELETQYSKYIKIIK